MIVAQVHEREQLAGDVTVLAPSAHLVVAQLGLHAVERQALRVLVDLRTPARPRGAGAPAPASTVSSVSPENEMANTSVLSETNAGGMYDFTTTTGTGMNGAAVARRMSPATPLPPMPRTTTLSMSSRSGNPVT